MNNPVVKFWIESAAFGFEDSVYDLDACEAEQFEAASGMSGIGVDAAHDDAAKTGFENGVYAGGRSAVGGAGFQRDVECGVLGEAGGGKCSECFDLGVWKSCATVVAKREEPVRAGDDCPDAGIGRGASQSGLFHSQTHEMFILHGAKSKDWVERGEGRLRVNPGSSGESFPRPTC
jgi:hypothetical protein